MLAEWSAACTDDDPHLVLPWSDATGALHFVDLRAEPYDIAEIAEAERFPALGRALRSLNATRSPFLTAKCDAWALEGEEHADVLAALRLELDIDPDSTRAGFGSYIDLLWRERPVFLSAHQQQARLDRIVRRAQRLEHNDARLELVLRPALYALGANALEGYAVSLYIHALGPEPETALRAWELALEDIVALLRNREFEIARTSTTIDGSA